MKHLSKDLFPLLPPLFALIISLLPIYYDKLLKVRIKSYLTNKKRPEIYPIVIGFVLDWNLQLSNITTFLATLSTISAVLITNHPYRPIIIISIFIILVLIFIFISPRIFWAQPPELATTLPRDKGFISKWLRSKKCTYACIYGTVLSVFNIILILVAGWATLFN